MCCCFGGCGGDYTEGSVRGRELKKKELELFNLDDVAEGKPGQLQVTSQGRGTGTRWIKDVLRTWALVNESSKSIRAHSEAPGDASPPLCCYLAALHQAGSREIPNTSTDWDLSGHVPH